MCIYEATRFTRSYELNIRQNIKCSVYVIKQEHSATNKNIQQHIAWFQVTARPCYVFVSLGGSQILDRPTGTSSDTVSSTCLSTRKYFSTWRKETIRTLYLVIHAVMLLLWISFLPNFNRIKQLRSVSMGNFVWWLLSVMLGFTPKWGDWLSQNILKLILKSPTFVPFGANLTPFGAKPSIPDYRYILLSVVEFSFSSYKNV